jgi:dUTP pyrophosphatase
MSVPVGYEMQIRPRSGLSLKNGVGILNAPGTVDEDYRGEIKVILVNLSDEPFSIRDGDRIAQMVLSPVPRADLLEVDQLNETKRGEGGFGHTGLGDGADSSSTGLGMKGPAVS